MRRSTSRALACNFIIASHLRSVRRARAGKFTTGNHLDSLPITLTSPSLAGQSASGQCPCHAGNRRWPSPDAPALTAVGCDRAIDEHLAF